MKYLILSDRYRSPKRDSNLGPSRIAVFKDSKANTLTAQPPATTAGFIMLIYSHNILQYCYMNFDLNL